MAQIRLLDQATVNKIAAGEVVERPASIVKELAENAVDAGATQITVEIKEGGISSLRITDNGCGIEAEEIRTAFLRHSTSKIRRVEDLLSSMTLGFRGEALASIAAVARVEILTKPAKALTGIRYVIEGGVEKVWEEVACPSGTTLKVENLFFNTPARKKFLKKPAAEAAAITDLLQKMALGHPEISFRYLNGKREPAIYTPGKGDLKNSIYAVYGREMLDKMLPLAGELPLSDGTSIRVEGYISRPQMTRANRSYENFFLNGRYIRSNLLERAVDEAYKDYIVPGQFPAVVLHLHMNPAAVDVNVHPTKMEVRFMQEDVTRRTLYGVISSCLSGVNLIARSGSFFKAEAPKPAAQEQTQTPTLAQAPKPAPLPPVFVPQQKPKARPEQKVPKWPVSKPDPSQPFIVEESDLPAKSNPSPAKPAENKAVYQGEQIQVHEERVQHKDLPPLQEEAAAYVAPPREHHLRLVGQIFRTYWLAEEEDIFYIIDQHAAHERVLYDRFRQLLQDGQMDTQMLMEPAVYPADPKAVAELESYQPIFQKLGFQVEVFGEDAVIVRGVPFLFNAALPAEDFTKMLDMLHEGHMDTARDLLIDKIAMMSCKAAVKGNMNMSVQEAESLLKQLFASPNPYNCPHGRPTIISMTQYELEKKFKRV